MTRRSCLLVLAASACAAEPSSRPDTAGEASGSEAAGGLSWTGAPELSSGTSSDPPTGSTGATGPTGSTGSTGVPCTDEVPGPAEAAPYSFMLGDQLAWSHDDGFAAGWFHTFDALDVGGPDDLPHKVHVFLPRDYDACGPGYPVLYMNDGNTSFWPGGAGNKTWDVAGRLAELYAEDAIPRLIVVAIVPNDREYEYSHTPWKDGANCCGVEQYAAYVADRVRGFVDAHYNTRVGPAHTAIVGSSRGGLAAFYLANRRPEVFGRAGCLSPSFWVGLDPVYGGDLPGGPLAGSALVQTLAGTLTDPQIRPRLWIDWGLVRTGGFHNEVIEAAATERGREMVELLRDVYGYQEGSELHWLEDPLGEHDEVTWSRHLPDVLRALFD